jgi:hypothetical protein
MKKLYLLVLLLAFPTFAQLTNPNPHETIKLIARIKTGPKDYKIISDRKEAPVTSALKDISLKKTISTLSPGDDALIEGHIIYESTMKEGQKKLKPVFLIESIHPISLQRLGKIDLKEMDQEIHIKPIEYDPKKGSIPVTANVASAITITAGVLLLQNLTPPDQGYTQNKDLNMGLIFSAGALATGIFIYDQMKDQSNRGK